MEEFVIADTHLGHKNVLLHSLRTPWLSKNQSYDPSRPYHFGYNNPWMVTDEDIERHDTAIIENNNKMVSKRDKLFIIGDLAFRDHERYLTRLNGKKVFVEGNHDDMKGSAKRHFMEMYQICRKTLLLDSRYRNELAQFDSRYSNWTRQDVFLSHYAMGVWANSVNGSWNLYGHSHGRYPEFDTKLQFDVGVDLWGYGPVPWIVIQERMIRKLRKMYEVGFMKEGKKFYDGENSLGFKDPPTSFDDRIAVARTKNAEVMAVHGFNIGYPEVFGSATI